MTGLLTVIGLLAVLAGPGRAADGEDKLRERALAFNDVTGSDPIEGEIKILTDDPVGTKKLLRVVVPMAREKDQPFNYNAAYILGRAAHELKNADAAELFYRICADDAKKLKSGHKLAQSYGGLIELYYDNKKYDESIKVCKEILELKDDDGGMRRLKSAVLRLMIQAMAKQGQIDEALKLVDNLVKARADDWKTLELKAVVLREAGQNAEAAKTYEEVLDLIGKDKSLEKDEKSELQDNCRYILSGVYVDLNQIDKAAAQLKALLAEKPDNPTYNNDLGYIWADHDMNLDEAEKLIRKAIDEERKTRKKDPELKPEDDKDNAAYLDSLGWVLFKQKKYAQAKKFLQEAVQDKDEGQHTEIYEHLGDVQAALGDKAEAAKAYKKAVELATSKREQERKSKIEKKLKEME